LKGKDYAKHRKNHDCLFPASLGGMCQIIAAHVHRTGSDLRRDRGFQGGEEMMVLLESLPIFQSGEAVLSFMRKSLKFATCGEDIYQRVSHE